MIPNTPFSFSVPTAVRFGDGVSSELATVLPKNTQRVAVIRGGGGVAARGVIRNLRDAGLTVTEIACPGEPSVASVNAGVADLAPADVQVVVACGGGAVMDSAKAIAFCLAHALRLQEDFASIPPDLLSAVCPIPCIAIPTTAGTGAEVTANAVLEIPSERAKVSLRGRALIPAAALVDPLLLPSAPPTTVLYSGLDAVVQTVEAYTSAAATPFSDAMTAPNVKRGLRALRAVVDTGAPSAWRDLAWVSLTSGLALANSGLGAAHGLASVLGGRLNAPHGALCGLFLTPVLRRNAVVAVGGSGAQRRLAECRAAIAEVFPPEAGLDDLTGLEAWQQAQGLPRLADFGLPETELEALAAQSAAASSSRKNAVVLGDTDFAQILRQAT
jgi:alcohol dehydrogenase class IV